MEHPDESVIDFQVSEHNIPKFDLHTDFFEQHFQNPKNPNLQSSNSNRDSELLDEVDDMIGSSSMKQGTLGADKNQEYFSPMTEQFELKQNSFEYNLDQEERKLSKEFSGNKNFKDLAPNN